MNHLFHNMCPRCKSVMILTHPRDHGVPVWICPVCGKTLAVANIGEAEFPAAESQPESTS